MEFIYTMPLLWLTVLVAMLMVLIGIWLLEKLVLEPKWDNAQDLDNLDSFDHYIRHKPYGLYGRKRWTWVAYLAAAGIAIISFVLMINAFAYNDEHSPQERELVVASPTTIAEDGTRYVELDWGNGRFTYICGETDQCSDLERGDTVVYTRYTDDNNVVQRYGLHQVSKD